MGDKELWRQFVREAETEVSRKTMRVVKKRVNSDSPEGFKWFYRLTRNMVEPPYFERWAKDLYNSNGYWLNEAFRGSAKTTTITETFTAYQIGLHPERSNGFAQASDDSVKVHASNVADMIEKNPGFQLLFPHVVPDYEKGWGAKGYWVNRNDMEYGEWVRMRDKEPTLYTGSYRNSIHIGKHPTGVFIFDDINDMKNTESDRMNKEVNDWLTDTMLPVMDKTNWRILNQTPWTTRDALALCKEMGVWKHTRTPIYTKAEKGEGEHVYVEKNDNVLLDEWVHLAWPERFTAEDVATIYKAQTTGGPIGFARMYLLDLSAAEGIELKKEWLHVYPKEDISETWPVVIGVDYASTADKLRDRGRDYFALAVGRLVPGGGVILVDGFRGHVSQGEAIEKTRGFAAAYATTSLIAVEAVGKGEEFYYLLLHNSRAPLMPAQTGNRSKGARFQKQMAPLFQMGRAWITDQKSPFLEAFKNEWVQWPNSEHDDTLDAVYYMTLAATQMGGLAPPPEDLTGEKVGHWAIPQPAAANPWSFR